MFAGNTVDGTTAFVPGQDFFEEDEPAEDGMGYDAEEDFVGSGTPTSTGSRKSKRSLTCDNPVKKTKSPMVRYMRKIATTFSEAVQVNQQVMNTCVADKRKAKKEKELFSVKRCLELAFECGIEQSTDVVFAMAKLFQDPFQREFFCGLPSAELRFNYFKKWCKEQNLD